MIELKWETASLLLGPRSSSENDDPIAARSDLERIREHLNNASTALLTSLPEIKEFLKIRDNSAYAPEYATLDDYLSSVGVEPSWFHSKEKLFEAVVEWSQDGPADNLAELLRMQISEDESVP